MTLPLNFRTGGPSLAEEMQKAGVFLDTKRQRLVLEMMLANFHNQDERRERVRKQMVAISRKSRLPQSSPTREPINPETSTSMPG